MDLDIGGILAEVGGALSAQAAGGAEGLNNFLAAQSQRRQQASAQAFQRESQTRDQLFRQEQSELDRQFRAEEAAKERSFRGTQAKLDRETLKSEESRAAEEAAAALTLSVADDTRLQEQLRSRVGAAPDAPFAEVASSLVDKVGPTNVGVVLGAAREAIQGEDRTAEFVGVTSEEFGAVSPEERLRISQQAQFTENKLTGWEAQAADFDARRAEILQQELPDDRKLDLLADLDAEYLSLSTAWQSYKNNPTLLGFGRPGSPLSGLETKVSNHINKAGSDLALAKEGLETQLALSETWGRGGIDVLDSRVFDPDISPKARQLALSQGEKAAHFDSVVELLRDIEGDTLYALGLNPEYAMQLQGLKSLVDTAADQGRTLTLLEVGEQLGSLLNTEGGGSAATKTFARTLQSVFDVNPETLRDRIFVREEEANALAEADASLNSRLSPYGITLETLPEEVTDNLLGYTTLFSPPGGGPQTRRWDGAATSRFMRDPRVRETVVTKLVSAIPAELDLDDRNQAIQDAVDGLQLERAEKEAYLADAQSRTAGQFGSLSPEVYRPVRDMAAARQAAKGETPFDDAAYAEDWKRSALFSPDERQAASLLQVLSQRKGVTVRESTPLTYEDVVTFFNLQPAIINYTSYSPESSGSDGSKQKQLKNLRKFTSQDLSKLPLERQEGAELLLGFLRNMTDAELEEAFLKLPNPPGITLEAAGFTQLPEDVSVAPTREDLLERQLTNVTEELTRMEEMTGRGGFVPGLFTDDAYLTQVELAAEKQDLAETAAQLQARIEEQDRLKALLPNVWDSPATLFRVDLDYKDPRRTIADALRAVPISASDPTTLGNVSVASQAVTLASNQLLEPTVGDAADQLFDFLQQYSYAHQLTLPVAAQTPRMAQEAELRNRGVVRRTEVLADLMQRDRKLADRLSMDVRAYLDVEKWSRMPEATADDRFFKAYFLLAATEKAALR
jgi:hypothetical protein